MLARDLVLYASRFVRRANGFRGNSYSATTWHALAELRSRGPMRVSELSAMQRVAQPTMTALIHRLEADGWVERESDPADGRASLIRILPAGVEAVQSHLDATAREVAPLIEELDPEEQRVLAQAAGILRRLSAATH